MSAVIRPDDVFDNWWDIDSADNVEFFPVIEGHKVFAFNCQKPTSEDTFALERRLECFVFIEILVDLYSSVFLATRIGVSIKLASSWPHELTCAAKRCVLVLGIGVDNEVILANHREISTTWSKFNELCGQFTDPELFYILRFDDLTIFRLFISTLEKL